MEQVAHLDEAALQRFVDSPQAQTLRERLRDFKGIPGTGLPGASRRNCDLIKRTVLISFVTSRIASSAEFWPMTWVWEKRSRHWLGSPG